MTSTVGRYRDASRATTPGELPAEGLLSKRVPVPKARKLESVAKHDVGTEKGRGTQRRRREADAAAMSTSRAPGEGAFIRHGSVPDPNPTFRGKRQRAAINVRTDALEREYANGRIGEAAYIAGRKYRQVLERSRRPISAAGAWSPSDRVDQVIAHDIAITSRIDNAREAVAMISDTAPAIGMVGQRLLELVLIDELTLTDAAQRLRGRADRQDVIFYSELFRQSCEALADHWCRRDRRAPR